MILVAGSTGMVGSEVCRRLILGGESVRALVRDTTAPEKIARLEALGAEIAVGDLRNPRTLETACQDIDVVISTVSSMPFSYVAGVNDIRTTDTDGTINLLEAARTAGVTRFVELSFSSNIDTPCPLGDAKRTVERAVMSSGLEYAILRPSYFMEVWLTPAVGFDPINARATIYGNGDKPISWISIADVAELVVRSATSSAGRNVTLELGGPAALSPLDVVGTFEKVARRPFTVEHVPLEALEGRRVAATDPMDQSFSALMCSYARGDAIDMGEVLATFPMALTSVEVFAERSLGLIPTGAG